MSTPHTPGPWIAKPTAGHDIHGQSVVYAETGGRGTDVAIIYNGAADADLIAAAPDLKAALIELHSAVWSLLEDNSIKIPTELLTALEGAAGEAESALEKAGQKRGG